MTGTRSGIGWRYLEETRYDREGLRGEPREFHPRSPLYKEYPADGERVELPRELPEGGRNFWESVRARRSQRDYTDGPVTLRELAALLWACQGITLATPHHAYRAAPSAGALYPVETYVAVHRVTGAPPGLWHFNVPDFALELIAYGDFRRALIQAGLNQQFLGTAAAVFLWTGVLGRALWKYRQRAVRYLFLDAGHICGQLQLAASALGLGCCPVAAFFDGEVEALLQVDPQEEVAAYLAAVGRPA